MAAAKVEGLPLALVHALSVDMGSTWPYIIRQGRSSGQTPFKAHSPRGGRGAWGSHHRPGRLGLAGVRV